jgi:hypothetical protein
VGNGLVIVGSILLAFAIDAGWDGRQERSRARTYVNMLADDARATLLNNANFSARADSVDWAGARLVRAYYEAELPPVDSIERWFPLAVRQWVVQPRLGTGEGLVANGDVRLIRSDSLRLALSRYLTDMRAFDEFEQQSSDDFRAAAAELLGHIDIQQLEIMQLSPEVRDSLADSNAFSSLPSGALRSLEPVNAERLVRDTSVHRILLTMYRAKTRMRGYRTLMRTSSERFLEVLETNDSR